MSQDTFPFADTDEALPYVNDAGPNRKKLLIVGAAGAAAVLLAGGWFLMGSSNDTTSTAFLPPARPGVKVATPTLGTPAKPLPAPYKATLGRDPFKALYVVPAAAPAAAPGTVPAGTKPTGNSPTATTPTGTTPTGTTPTGTAPSGTTPTGTGNGTSGTGTPPSSTRYTLKLVSISKPSPEVRFTTWKVGTDSKTVIPAQRFGKYGELVVLAFSKNASGVVDKAIIQVGDGSPLDVKIGESVSVL